MDFIIVPFINVLLYIYQFLGQNFGWAIIIFTILVRLLTYPLNKQQLESAQKMQDLQKDPRWQKMQKQYKNDREKLAQEQMKLYQDLGINPLGSCLPTFIQFPIIIGLYMAVSRTLATSPIQLITLIRDVSISNLSSLIPLNNHFWWMDLSQPERLVLDFLPVLPWIGKGIPVLAIVVFITTYYQAKLTTPTSTDPNDPSAAMSRSMTLMMPVMMAWFSFSFPASVGLYFVVSNLASILQYVLMGRIKLGNLLPSKS